MKDHVRIEEQLAARALGGLEAVEAEELARAMAGHGYGCPDCRRLEAQYEEVAGRLAFALVPADVPDEVERRIFAPIEHETARRSWSRLPRALAVAAAAALLAAGAAAGGYLLAPRPAPALKAAASYLSQPGTRIAPLQGSAQGNLALAFGPGRNISYLIGSDLRRPPDGKVYELWLRRSGQLQRAAVFSTGGDLVVVMVPFDPSTATEAAVTLERAPGVDRPTTNPIFSAVVSA